jgi:hypothetical protein
MRREGTVIPRGFEPGLSHQMWSSEPRVYNCGFDITGDLGPNPSGHGCYLWYPCVLYLVSVSADVLKARILAICEVARLCLRSWPFLGSAMTNGWMERERETGLVMAR